MTDVRHVLLDADGVLQRVRGGWQQVLVRHLGDRADDFIMALDRLETPSITGDGDFPAGLEQALADHGSAADPEEFYASLWLAVEVLPETVALARSLREAGLGVHLATNQHARRAAYMKDTLGYSELFDSCFYSCDLGVAKPDAAFFKAILADLGTTPGQVCFVDDSAANVAGARAVGLHAVQWEYDDGTVVLQERLGAIGVRLDRRSSQRR